MTLIVYLSGRGEGIRTLDSVNYTRVPGVRLQPLGHPSKEEEIIHEFF